MEIITILRTVGLTFGLYAMALPAVAAVQPADLAGAWDIEVKVDQESHQAKLVFRLENGTLTGRVQGGNRDLELKALQLEGDTVTFSVNTGEQVVNFTLKISAGTMEGTLKMEDQTGSVTGKKQS